MNARTGDGLRAWLRFGILMLVALLSIPSRPSAAGTLAQGYARVKPSLVKVWGFNAAGVPIESGTGFVVQSDARHSWIVTALHVVLRAAKVRIDVSRDVHDISAAVVARSSTHQDIALLMIPRGNLPIVHIANKDGAVAEGDSVAAAGYFKYDEQIGVGGQAPQLVGPGTVGSLPDGGRFIQVNLYLESGLSGAPVFDPASGDVVGVIETKSTIGQGGYAVSAPLVVLDFLSAHHVAANGAPVPKHAVDVVAVTIAKPAPRPSVGLPGVAAVPVAAVPMPSIPIRLPLPAAQGPRQSPARAANDACFAQDQTAPRDVIDACSRLIAGGTMTDRDLKLAYFYRSRAYNGQKRFALAVDDLSRVLNIDPSDATAYNDRGFAYIGQGRYDVAIADFTRAIRIDPRDVVAYYNRASANNHLENFDVAIADLTLALNLDSTYVAVYNLRGSAYTSIGAYDLAIADLTRAVSIDPNDALGYTYRGNAYSEEGSFGFAILDYDRAVRIDPNMARAYTGRGYAYEMERQESLALTDYDRAVRIDPGQRTQIMRVSHVYGR